MFYFKLYILFVISVINIKLADSLCRKHFVVICDTLSDVGFNSERGKWTELMIQPKNIEEVTSGDEYTLSSKHFDRNLNKLKWLIINQQLVRIEINAFTYCRNLEQLILYGNNIKEIVGNTFVYLRRLNYLKLQNNNIETLTDFAFTFCIIELLDMSFNQLQILPTNLFVKSSVNILRITNNRLWKISMNSLPRQLTVFNLDYNSFEDIPDEISSLTNLKELTFSHNNLRKFPNVNLQLLEKLDLSFNRIVTVTNELNVLTNLKYLDLSGNRITKIIIKEQFFTTVKDQLVLLLAHNKLTNLELPKVDNVEIILSLSGNPWNCECMNKIQKFLFDNSITRTQCDQMIFDSGVNPYCIAEHEQCSNHRFSKPLLEKFEQGYKTGQKICDVFSDVNVLI